MEAISKSAEHHFLANLHTLKSASQGWVILTFSLSQQTRHKDVLKNASSIHKFLTLQREKAEQEFEILKELCETLPRTTLYMFEDNDLMVLSAARSPESKDQIQEIFKTMAARVEHGLSDFGYLEHELYSYQKYCDQKMLSAKRIAAYREMADRHKISTIGIRRERRDQPLVQVIEDDRFTASYTANILNREYDMILARNGEDAIMQYIDQAPDIVFIDIHLPGLDGHAVLQALKIIDPKIYAVMLSVDTVRDNIVKSADSGANNFLKKPFSKERLLNVVKTSPYVQGWMRRHSDIHTH